MSIGCGCKEVYRFSHTTYPYSSCIHSFLQQHPLFVNFNFFFVLYIYIMLDSSIFCLRSTVEPLYSGNAWDRKLCPE